MSFSIPVRDIDWPVTLFIVAYHVGLLIGLPFYFYHAPPGAALILVSAVLLILTEIGIGGAYHRYYAHRCYALSKPAEAALLFLATLAIQGSALRWSHDHRKHHSCVDTDDDPYSIKKGFWHAHVLWLFKKAPPLDPRVVRDLLRNRMVMFQHKCAGTLSVTANLVVCGLIGWLLDDYLGAFVLAWWTRLFLSHHLTWFVNSLAHTWGEKTYSKEHSAVDNYILAFLTVGEGYHNYHHTFASDYRNGVRWYHFDPTKWTIWTLSKVGLARNLKRYNTGKIRLRLLMEDKRLLLETLRQRAHAKKVDLEQRIHSLANRLQMQLSRISALAEEIKRLKERRAERATVRAIRRELRDLRHSTRRDWRNWSRLCALVLEPHPA